MRMDKFIDPVDSKAVNSLGLTNDMEIMDEELNLAYEQVPKE